MRTFFSVLKNDYLRTIPRIVPLSVFTLITLASVFFAVSVTGIRQVKAHVAVIPQSESAVVPETSKDLSVTVLSRKPPFSALVERKYDAFVTVEKDGQFRVETLRGREFQAALDALLKNPAAQAPAGGEGRGIGVNILGFMMMFLLMTSFFNLFVFADDKEQGQLRRIAASPASFGWYLAAHCAYCLSLMLPEYLLLAVLKLCGREIGFSLPQYAGMMALLGFFGISFALLMNTLIHKPDNASMLGNALIVLTSVLSGGFYPLGKDNAVLSGLASVLPQKNWMDFALSMQNGRVRGHTGSILYVAFLSLALFVFSCAFLRRSYGKRT